MSVIYLFKLINYYNIIESVYMNFFYIGILQKHGNTCLSWTYDQLLKLVE